MKKRILSLVLAMAMVFACAACSNTNETDENGSTKATTAKATTSGTTAASSNSTYSYLLTDSGYLDGYKTSKYVDIPKDWASVKLTKADYEPTEATIENYLTAFAENYQVQDKNAVIKDGDTVSIDYVGSVDGATYDGMTSTGAEVVAGSEDYIDDFLTQIIGHKGGENFDIEVTFPDPYSNNTALSGKDAIFNITVNYVLVTPEFTEEFLQEHLDDAKTFYGSEDIKTVSDVKQIVFDYLYENNLTSGIVKHLNENFELKKDLDDKLHTFGRTCVSLQYYQNYGVTIDDLIASYGLEEDFFEEDIVNSVKLAFILQAVAEKLGRKITEEEVIEELTQEVYDAYIDTYGLPYFAHSLLQSEMIQYLKDNITIE